MNVLDLNVMTFENVDVEKRAHDLSVEEFEAIRNTVSDGISF
jgi:hypothetical protein